MKNAKDHLSRRQSLSRIALAGLGVVSVSACSTKIRATSLENPPPPEAFSAYGRIVLKPVRSIVAADAVVLQRIQANLEKELSPFLKTWNSAPQNDRVLTIDPVIEAVDFKDPATRVVLGPLTGGSGIFLRLILTDSFGKTIARPEFVQTAGAWAAGLSVGTKDAMMLTHVAQLASGYLQANYKRAVGGPTGAIR